MSLVDLILMAEAAESRAAVRKTAFRHVHLADRPLIVVAFNLSGEAAAPIGIMWGTSKQADDANFEVSGEPRNRDSRFGAINAFCDGFTRYLSPHLRLDMVPQRRGGGFRQVAKATPQIVVPNRATLSYLGARLGRSLRYLGLGETHDVPETTQWGGAHLSWLAEHSNLPGQSVFVAATEVLADHFATGQSDLEDANLASLLAWIEGLPEDALTALESVEDTAYGPTPNPKWEAELEPLIRSFGDALRAGDNEEEQRALEAVAKAVRPKLADAYSATHRAIEVLRKIPPASGVAERWRTDERSWTSHAIRASKGIPRFARRHDPLRAARALQQWSAAAERLETQKAFDDPLVLARLDAEGRCITGVVESLDTQNSEVKPGNSRRSSVPLIDIRLTGPTQLLVGERTRLVDDKRVAAVVRNRNGDLVRLAVMEAAKAFGEAQVTPGDEIVFAGLDPWEGQDPWGPDEVPWTHRNEDGPTDDSAPPDDSPDMTLSELAELPIVGIVDPDDVSGVVL